MTGRCPRCRRHLTTEELGGRPVGYCDGCSLVVLPESAIPDPDDLPTRKDLQ